MVTILQILKLSVGYMIVCVDFDEEGRCVSPLFRTWEKYNTAKKSAKKIRESSKKFNIESQIILSNQNFGELN